MASGCTYFDGVGYFHNSRELFDAKIEYNLYTTMAAIEVTSKDGLLCTGAARAKHTTGTRWSCMGAQGNFFMSCNDGRHLIAKWSADTCSSGQSIGGDQYGNTFVASFGENRNEMLRRVGAGPGEPVPAYADYAPSPMYASLLGHDSEGELMLYADPQEQRAPLAASAQRKTPIESYGFFISPDGYMLIYMEALPGATEFMVRLPGKPAVPARLVRYDQKSGVALLKADLDGLGIPLASDGEGVSAESIVLGPPRDGAPILNSNGEVVGLICKGIQKNISELRQIIDSDIPLGSFSKKADASLPELLKLYSGSLGQVKIRELPRANTSITNKNLNRSRLLLP